MTYDDSDGSGKIRQIDKLIKNLRTDGVENSKRKFRLFLRTASTQQHRNRLHLLRNARNLLHFRGVLLGQQEQERIAR